MHPTALNLQQPPSEILYLLDGNKLSKLILTAESRSYPETNETQRPR